MAYQVSIRPRSASVSGLVRRVKVWRDHLSHARCLLALSKVEAVCRTFVDMPSRGDLETEQMQHEVWIAMTTVRRLREELS